MTDDNGKTPKDQRNLTITVNRNEDRAYTIFSVRDEDQQKLLADVIIPDDTLISETYRMGGNIRPLEVLREIASLVFESLHASFEQLIASTDSPVTGEESSDEPPEAN